jgi:hypothetical protein
MAEQKSVNSVNGFRGPWASDIQQSGTSQNYNPPNTELPPALPERGRKLLTTATVAALGIAFLQFVLPTRAGLWHHIETIGIVCAALLTRNLIIASGDPKNKVQSYLASLPYSARQLNALVTVASSPNAETAANARTLLATYFCNSKNGGWPTEDVRPLIALTETLLNAKKDEHCGINLQTRMPVRNSVLISLLLLAIAKSVPEESVSEFQSLLKHAEQSPNLSLYGGIEVRRSCTRAVNILENRSEFRKRASEAIRSNPSNQQAALSDLIKSQRAAWRTKQLGSYALTALLLCGFAIAAAGHMGEETKQAVTSVMYPDPILFASWFWTFTLTASYALIHKNVDWVDAMADYAAIVRASGSPELSVPQMENPDPRISAAARQVVLDMLETNNIPPECRNRLDPLANYIKVTSMKGCQDLFCSGITDGEKRAFGSFLYMLIKRAPAIFSKGTLKRVVPELESISLLPEGKNIGPIYDSVIRAARQTLPVCTAILQNHSDQSSLMRASTANEAADNELVRPAQEHNTELLRSASPCEEGSERTLTNRT